MRACSTSSADTISYTTSDLVEGEELRASGFEFRVSGFRVYDFRDKGVGFRLEVDGLWFTIDDL